MPYPVFYQTLNMEGVDVTQYSTAQFTAGASVTPEYPSPPFIPGTQAFGSDGSQFLWVQASTSISLTDFVIITNGSYPGYLANSITSTNVQSSLACALGSTGLIVKNTVSYIPAGAYFWACTRGQFLPATTSGTFLTQSAGNVALFTSPTAGVLTSTVSLSSGAFAGIVVINSLTVSIPASTCPPAGGTLSSTGFTVGPVVNLNTVRTIVLNTATAVTAYALYW